MTVCVIGSGAREHALAHVLARTDAVVVTPGNPGMPAGGAHPVTCSPRPPEEIEADLYVIGPEAPLVDGLADRLRARGHLVVGPGADGAALEGSKAFMKAMLDEAGVPTARFGAFGDLAAARAFLSELPGPWVIKTDGLAAGKGVLVATDRAAAEADLAAKLSGEAFGDAGRRVVIEEGLIGVECTLLVLCDGRRVVPLAASRDFKRLDDDDGGPNTGGMGCYSPLPDLDDGLVSKLIDECVEPLVGTLVAHGIDYRGVLYAGLMLTAEGPKVLEFNVRFGDPETQVVVPRLEGDLVELLTQTATGRLGTAPHFSESAAVCVVQSVEGYPAAPRTGDVISGLAADGQLPDTPDGVIVFHAGTELDGAGRFRTAGGRVLGVTAVAPSLSAARDRAYAAAARISWPGSHYRSDIAHDAVLGAAALR